MKSKIRHDVVYVGVRKFAIAWIYHPETPDVWYLRNGDPGYPATLLVIRLLNGDYGHTVAGANNVNPQ